MSDDLHPSPFADTCARFPSLRIGFAGALPPGHDAGPGELSEQGAAAISEVEALGPTDALETMVADQVVLALRNGFECFHQASTLAFAGKEATALRREGLAHQRVMISAARLLLKAQQRSAPPKQVRAAKPAAEPPPADGRDPDRWAFAKPLPPEFSLPVEQETVGPDGKIVPPRRHHLPVEYLSPHLQEIYRNDPSLLYLRENWKSYKGWENMTKEERLKMFGYKHSEYAKRHLMKKPEGEQG